MAAADGPRDDGHADLVDLHAVGRRLGIHPGGHRLDRLVLAERNTGGRSVRERVIADLSRLPLHGQGSASVTWWGTLAFMLIEGTGFALVLAIARDLSLSGRHRDGMAACSAPTRSRSRQRDHRHPDR